MFKIWKKIKVLKIFSYIIMFITVLTFNTRHIVFTYIIAKQLIIQQYKQILKLI